MNMMVEQIHRSLLLFNMGMVGSNGYWQTALGMKRKPIIAINIADKLHYKPFLPAMSKTPSRRIGACHLKNETLAGPITYF